MKVIQNCFPSGRRGRAGALLCRGIGGTGCLLGYLRPSGSQAGADEFIERRMADQFELDVQTLQEDAPTDASPSLVALAAQLIEVRRVTFVQNCISMHRVQYFHIG